MNKLGTALLSASALLVAGTAAAELPEWTYGQIGYYQADSFGDEQTDAFTVNASIGFLDIWHLQAGYMDGSLGRGNFTNDFDGWSVTAGAHPAITDDTQLVVNGVFYSDSFDVDNDEVESLFTGSKIDRDGFGVGLGLRSNITEKVEGSVIGYWTTGEFDQTNGCGSAASSSCDTTNVSLQLAGRYNFTKNFSTGATVIIGDPITGLEGSSANSMNLDVRYTFAGLRL